MRFNQHSLLEGKHAFLSASKGSWVNYDDDKLERVYKSSLAAQKGTDLHKLANDLIRLGVPLRETQTTMNMYVNDGIGFRMTPEVLLVYSPNCFGTTDTISFRKNLLRIHDLKTGLRLSSVRQLEIYAALFCLEYMYKPHEIDINLRIYQNDEIKEFEGDPDVIAHIMDKIKTFDRRLNEIREELL